MQESLKEMILKVLKLSIRSNMLNTDLMFSSKTDQWSTPKDFFNKINDEFSFTMDACASEENKKCEVYLSEKNNSLIMPWHGIVWMNPPYGRGIGLWIQKAYNESLLGATVVCLIPARTDTRWFHDYCQKGEIRFIKGRLKFGGSVNSAPFPSMLVIFRGVDHETIESVG